MSWNKIKQQVLERDKHTCQMCLKPFKFLQINHIIPRRLKGLDSLSNLFSVCRQCHDIVELKPPPKIVKYKVVIFKDDPPGIKKLKQIAIDNNIIEYINCSCGCGLRRYKYNVKGKEMKFIAGHQNRGVNNPFYGKTPDEIKSSNKPQQEYIECACGCKKIKPKYDNWGRPSRFIEGHNNRGKKGLKRGSHITNGYRFILKPDHHLADSKGYVPEHRLKFEEYHKCCLLSWAAIHHINENKLDNSIENLEGMTKKQYKILHGKELIHLGNHIKTRTHVKNQFGVFEIKKRNLVK